MRIDPLIAKYEIIAVGCDRYDTDISLLAAIIKSHKQIVPSRT